MYALATHQLQVKRRGRSISSQSRYELAPHQLQVERVIVPIKWMRSPTTSYRWRGERDIEPIKCMCSPTQQLQVERRERQRANQVYALTTHQPTGARGESHRCQFQVFALTTHQLQAGERGRENRAIHVLRSSTTPAYRWRVERETKSPIKCMRSPTTPATGEEGRDAVPHRANQVYASATHQLTCGGGESHRGHQVDALTTHQLHVERRRREYRANSSGYAPTTQPAT